MTAPVCKDSAVPLGEILYGLYGDLAGNIVVVIVRACIDECSTHKNEPDAPMLLCGTVARVPRWQIFDRDWRKTLKKEGLSHLHTKDLISQSGEFDGWELGRCAALVDRCIKHINRSVDFSFCTILYKADFKSYRRHKDLNTILESDYGVSFRLAISFLQVAVPQLIPGKGHRVYLVVEKGHPNCGCAKDLTTKLRNELPDCIIQSPVAYVHKDDSYGTQAADLMAYWALIKVERAGDPDYSDLPMDKIKESSRTSKEPPFFRLPVKPEILTEIRDDAIRSKPKFMKRFGHFLSSPGSS